MVIFCYQGELVSSFEAVDYEVGQVGAALAERGCLCKQFLFRVDYALRELLNNAVEHANQLDTGKKVKYHICCDAQLFEVTVRDEGNKLAVLAESPPGQPLEDLSYRQRGLTSVQALGFELDLQPGKVVARLHNNHAENQEKVRMSAMEISYQEQNLICKLTDNLVAKNVKSLVEQLQAELRQRPDFQLLQMDLTASENIDSIGITFLVGTFKEVTGQGKKFKLTGVSEAMLQLFKVIKLDEVFELTTR